MESCLLEARDISVAFPGVRALDHVDFRLSAGEIHALAGANGAGKSTLMKVLAGTNPGYRGEVRLEGRRVEARGRSCHGSKPWEGENAISKLMAQLAGRPVADMYNACIGFDLYGERLGCQVEDDKVGALTVNVGKVRTMGDQIVFWLDIRYPTVITAQEILERMNQAVAPYGARVELEYDKKPVYLDREGPLISTLTRAYRQVTGDTQTQPVLMCGGTYAKAMDNIAAFGPALPGREPTEHQKNEHISLEDFLLVCRIYRQAILGLAQS